MCILYSGIRQASWNGNAFETSKGNIIDRLEFPPKFKDL